MACFLDFLGARALNIHPIQLTVKDKCQIVAGYLTSLALMVLAALMVKGFVPGGLAGGLSSSTAAIIVFLATGALARDIAGEGLVKAQMSKLKELQKDTNL